MNTHVVWPFIFLLPSIYIPLWEADVLDFRLCYQASLSEAIVSQDDTSIKRAFKSLLQNPYI